MAMDASTKKLLVQLGISTKDWQKTIAEIKAQLKQMNADSAKTQQEKQTRQEKELQVNKQLIADQKKMQAEARTLEAVDKAKAAWQKQQQEAKKTQIQQTVLQTLEEKKQSAAVQVTLKFEQERIKIAQMQLKLQQQQEQALLRQQKTERGGTEGGGIGGVVGTALKGVAALAGGGPIGMIAAGAMSGELMAKGMEMAAEKVRELAKEMMNATGPAGQLREQFEKLSTRAGVAPEEFLNKLRVATRGLVEDNTQLIKVANQFMQGPLKLQPEQIERLTGVTIALARAQGKDATVAINALSRAALTGRTQMLAMTVGISRAEMSATSMGRSVGGVAREQMQLAITMDAMNRRLAEVGTPMTTLKDLFSQIHMVQGAFIEDMAYSITHSKSFSEAIQSISSWIMKVTPAVLDFAKSIGEKLGEAFMAASNAMKLFASVGRLFVEQLNILGSLASSLLTVFGIMTGAGKEEVTWRKWLGTLTMMFRMLAQVVDEYTLRLTSAQAKWTAVLHGHFDEIKKINIDAEVALVKSRAEFAKDMGQIAGFMAGKSDQVDVGTAGKTVPPPPDPQMLRQQQQLRLQLARETAKTELEIQLQKIDEEKAANKEAYDSGLIALQAYLAKVRELNKQENKVKLAQIEADRKAELDQLAFEAKGYTTTAGEKVGGMDPVTYGLRLQQINEKARLAIETQNRAYAKENAATLKEDLADELAARREYVAAVNKINREGVQERLRQLDEEFKTGSVKPDEYIAQKKALYAEERKLADASAQDLYDASKKNETDLAKLRLTQLEDEVAYQKQITELVKKEGDYRLQYLDQKYNQAKKLLESQIKLETGGVEGALSGVAKVDEKALLDITEQHIRDLQDEQKKLGPITEDNANDWMKLAEQISQSKQEVVKLNEELFKSKDLTAPLATAFGQIAKDFSGVLPQSWESMLSKLSSTMKETSAMLQKQAGAGGGTVMGNLFHHVTKPATTVAQTATQIFEQAQKTAAAAVQSTTQTVDKAFQSTSSTVDNFRGTISNAVTATTQYVDAIQQAIAKLNAPTHEPVGGIGPVPLPGTVPPAAGEAPTITSTVTESGGISTAPPPPDASILPVLGRSTDAVNQFTQALITSVQKQKTLMDKLKEGGTSAAGALIGAAQSVTGTASTIMGAKSPGSGAFGGIMSGASTGMMFGPIGAGIGAIAGGIMGGLVGAKRQAVQHNVDKIKNQLQAIVDQLNDGTTSLGNAIAELRKERQDAIKLLSGGGGGKKGGGKKGQAQLPAVLEQIDAEIQKLVDAQKQLLDAMDQSLTVMSEPIAFQPITQQLDEIIKKYQEFASAAVGNTQAVANANQWLVESLKNYATTVSNDLNQANQTAINDALQLLDLEKQRYDLVMNEAKQEYDIMTEGVLTRERGPAAQKGFEIAQLRYQRDQQLMQMDEQIALANYKVTAEQKIFGLATTRIGLETQLLALQEQQAGLQLDNVTALQQALVAINQAISTGGMPNAFGPGGSLASGTDLLNQILAMLGLAPSGIAPSTPPANELGNIPQEWQGITKFMNTNVDPNFLTTLIAALSTPSGSSTRQALINEVQGAPDLRNQGYDISGFEKFIGSGTIVPTPPPTGTGTGTGTGPGNPPNYPPMPGYQVGTAYVPETGPALLHEGEAVIPAHENVFDATGSVDSTKLRTVTNTVNTSHVLTKTLTTVLAGSVMGGTTGRSFGPPASPAGPLPQPVGPYPIGPRPIGPIGAPLQLPTPIPTYLSPTAGSGELPAPSNVSAKIESQLSDLKLGTETQVTDMVLSRVSIEMEMLQVKQSIVAQEANNLQTMKELMSNGTFTGPGVLSLEGGLQKIYELRGRQGSGGYTRQTI